MLAVDVVPWLNVAQVDAVGSVIGGVGTVAAFGATICLIVREAGIRRSEQRDEESRQARLVFGSVTTATLALETGQNPAGSQAELLPWRIEVEVTNYSQEPIHAVKARVPGLEGVQLEAGRIGPGDTVKRDGYRQAPADWYVPSIYADGLAEPNYWMGRDLTFTDNSGRAWTRSGRDEPVRVIS